ncbi:MULTISPECIES: alpha-ketoglutarate-dependent dioxygenase AlkB [unclassified Sphingomonas]|uniref:alpha-ketoglutarate-dependent dioxygenase AlkB n=1 Tax=unclassified Sphingomonas TaxID=196159 RepID=UPI000E70D46D|nr:MULTISPECIES: alpha-ketoglutarate-dependent dioxygenase AlkB [unclassified Sphingomonas]RKE54006.1 alkylated DNA repair dioxygenase AlkB [Sphingomonas sp. PP-CC-1A-547]TCM10549.1 alkylated DNA repair dioxygenase AlkB [Sphingomonas sp. PP-CC-3G-468]
MANPTADLFGTPVLSGLEYRDALLSRDEEEALIARIDEQDLAPFQFQGWLGKRLTRSFGWHYDFDTSRFGETDPLPDWLLPIRRSAAAFAKLPEEALVQALLIRYDPGAGIGWHRDRPVFEHVVGISLGVPATMRFRRRKAGGFDRAAVPLAPRSVYHLSGEARHDWEHSIAEMEVTRWSITFRSFTASARQDRR